MNIPLFTTNIGRCFLALWVALGLSGQVVLAQELFTLQSTDKSKFSAELQKKMTNVENSAVHKKTMYVQVGNLAKIQKNGRLTFSTPQSGRPITFLARRVEAESERDFVWTGISEDGPYQAIFICQDGKLSGSFGSKHGNYQLYAIEEGTSMLMEIDLSKIGDCEAVGKAKAQTPVMLNGGRQDVCQEATRVLMLYTRAAADLVPDINQVVNLSIQQYNTTLNNSNLGNQITNTLVLAGVEYIGFTETNNATNDAVSISQRADAQTLRNQHNADIVVTLTGNTYTTSFGSVANDIPANNSTAYAVVIVNQASVAGGHTFTHETGHLFGGFHDNTTSGPSYAHGYVLPNQTQDARTIMAVRNAAQSGRILHFSNPNVSFGGTPTGTANFNDVARRIGEVSPTIVNFRSSVSSSFSAYVDGPSNVNNTGTKQFEVAYVCVSPNSFEWSVSQDGFTFGSPVAYSEVFYPYITSADNGLFYLRCRITLPNGQVNTIYKYVSVNICSGCRTGQENAEEGTSIELTASPNPTVGNNINLSFSLPRQAIVSVILTDNRSIPVKKIDFGLMVQGNHQKQMEVVGLNPGLYIISLRAGSQLRTQKVILTK